jgi:hypothetical protein
LSETDRDEYVASFIGTPVHAQFAAFIEAADLPMPADVLDKKVAFKWDTKRLDRTNAIISSCAALVCRDGADKRRERATVLWEILAGASNYDIIVPATKALVLAKLHVSKEANIVLSKINPALRTAGVQMGDSL